MANQYILDLSKNVRRGMNGKAARGWYPGCAVQGYLNDRIERTIVPDPDRFPLVRRMWDMMLTGLYTPRDVARTANHEWHYRSRRRSKTGGTAISEANLYLMFRNPFYMGMFRYDGKLHNGLHRPMVTAEEFQRVQEILDERRSASPRRYVHAFTGCMRCAECGCSITAEYKRKKRIDGGYNEHLYYHCTHSKDDGAYRCPERRGITLANLERSVVELLSSVTIHPDFARWARQELQVQHDREVAQSESVRDNLLAESKKLEKQRGKLTSCLIQEIIDEEEFERHRADLDMKVATVRKRLDQRDERERDWTELVRRTIDFAEGAKSRFIAGDIAAKKKIFLALAPSIYLRDGNLVLEPHPWFVPIQEMQNPLGKNTTIEPSVNKPGSGLPGLCGDGCREWSATLEAIRDAIINSVAPVYIPDIAE